MGDSYVLIPVLGGFSITIAFIVFIFHLINRKYQKNPYNLLLMGVIIVNMIMTMHVILSTLYSVRESYIGCYLVGVIGVFATFSCAAYHYFINDLIDSLQKVYNPRELSHKKYHFYSIIIGLGFSMIAIISEDIGVDCFDYCGTMNGSYVEFLSSSILIFVWPYCLYYGFKCLQKLCGKHKIVRGQRQLFTCHLLNILIYSVTWIPYLSYHFFNFVFKFQVFDSEFIEVFFPTLICLTPLLNTLTRVFCDPILRSQLNCLRTQTEKEFDMMMTSMLETEKFNQERTTDSTHHRPTALTKNSEPIYDKLTQVETLNNLLSTFSGICMLMDDVYDLYFHNQLTTDIIDLLASNELFSEELFSKKVSRIYSLKSLNKKYNSDNNYQFPYDLEKNFQENLAFKITEYSSIIFQNLRLRLQMSQDMFRESLLPFNNSKALVKSFEKTNARGGKPLIKTHDKRFLIKEVKKEERDFLLSILPKYNHHLKRHPNSLLAKIIGIYSIKIAEKTKVYHILMESLDPISEQFIKFKYDLKFSTVNRREFKSRQEANMVKEELLEMNPNLQELFPKSRDLNSLNDLSVNKTKQQASVSSLDNRSKENVRHKTTVGSHNKTLSLESGFDKAKMAFIGHKTSVKTNTNSESAQHDSDDDESDDNQLADDQDINEELENDEKFQQLDYDEQLIYREQKQLYRQQRKWNANQKIDLKTNPALRNNLLGKLGLLKDSDFKCLHDRRLPVALEDVSTVEDFLKTIETDIRFLESLRIMDYSLFLIVLEIPQNETKRDTDSMQLSCRDLDFRNYQRRQESMTKNNHFGSQILSSNESGDQQQVLNNFEEQEMLLMLDELIKMGKFVMFSPSKRFVYLMGIIDYLGRWNFSKKFEMYGKTFLAHFIRQNTDFSVKPPHQFARRFIKKVRRIFRIQKGIDGTIPPAVRKGSHIEVKNSFSQKRSFDIGPLSKSQIILEEFKSEDESSLQKSTLERSNQKN